MFAGKDHEEADCFVHDAGVIVAVTPEGMPLTVSVVSIGRVVPMLGVRSNVNVAVPPEVVVCDVPLPEPETGELTLKSVTA